MSVSGLPTHQSRAARAVRVGRVVRARAWYGATRQYWENWSARDASWLTGAYLTMAALFLLASMVMTVGPGATLAAALGHPRLAVASLVWLPLNAWLGDRFLSLYTRGELRIRPAVRWWRAAGAGVPVLGFHVSPLWRHLVRHHGEALSVSPAPLGLRDLFEASGSHRPVRRLVPGLARVWPLAQSLAVGPLLVWTMSVARAQPAWRLGLALVLQLGAAAAFAHSQWPPLSEPARGWLVVRLMLTCLLPFGGFVRVSPHDRFSERRTRCLTWSAYARGSSVERLREWSSLRQALHRRVHATAWWRVGARRLATPTDPHPGLVFRRIVVFARLKTWVLTTEAGAAAALLAHSAADSIWLERVGGALLAGAATLLVSGVVARAHLLIVRLLRLPSRRGTAQRRVWARFAVLVPIALGGALLFGFAMARGYAAYAALVTAYGGALLGMFAAYGLMLTPALARDRVFDDDARMPWAFAFLLLVLAAGMLAAAVHLTHFSPGRFAVILVVACVTDAVAAAAYARNLLRPFRCRHMGDPSVPLRMRVRLVVLAASAVLPFGGVVVPFWFHLRPQPGEVPPDEASARNGPRA